MSIKVVQPDLSASSVRKTVDLDRTLSNCPFILRYWYSKKYQRPTTITETPVRDEQNSNTYFGNTSAPLVVDGGVTNLLDVHILTTADQLQKKS